LKLIFYFCKKYKKMRIQQHYPIFEIIDRELLKKDRKVYLYFIKGNQFELGELRFLNGRQYIYLSDELIEKFKNISHEKILEQMTNLKYKGRYAPKQAYKNSVDEIKNAIKTKNKLITLNPICRSLFGPLAFPNNSSHSYNAYTSLSVNIEEIAPLLQDLDLKSVNIKHFQEKNFITLEQLIKLVDVKKFKLQKKENLLTQNELETNAKDILPENELESNAISLSKVLISNFVHFDSLELEFSQNINLFIGKNNTGKTSLLRLLYSVCKSIELYRKQSENYVEPLTSIFPRKISYVFNTKIGDLVSKRENKNLKAKFIFDIFENEYPVEFSLGKDNKLKTSYNEMLESEEILNNALFIPAKEVLGNSVGILNCRNLKYRGGFDDTYFDIVESFMSEGDKNEFEIDRILREISENIEKDIIRGKFIENLDVEERFLFETSQGKFNLSMTSEGNKQLGLINILIRKTLLRENTILFIDEIDTNLNPVSIRKIIPILVELSKAGIQIFIATHNYFVLHQFAIEAKKQKNVPMKCFSLFENNEKIEIEVQDLKLGLPMNDSITSEAWEMLNEDLKYD